MVGILRPGTVVNDSFLFWWVPAPISGFLSNFFAASGSKRFGTGATALQPALPAQLNGGLVFILVYRRCGRSIFDLASENVTDQFAKLDGVAGAFQALRCHGGSMPRFSLMAQAAEIQTVPLPI